MANITLFSQIISKLDRSKFNKFVKDNETDIHCKEYNSWRHLVSMLFMINTLILTTRLWSISLHPR